jgi:hypothetical protein
MSKGHTPGPWEISGGSIWAVTPWNARVRILTAEVHSRTNGVDWAANLRLAAAAPDLLVALEQVVGSQLGPQGSFPSIGIERTEAILALLLRFGVRVRAHDRVWRDEGAALARAAETP